MIFCTPLSTISRCQLRIACSSILEMFSQLSSKHSDPPMIVQSGCTKPGKSYRRKTEDREKKTQGEKKRGTTSLVEFCKRESLNYVAKTQITKRLTIIETRTIAYSGDASINIFILFPIKSRNSRKKMLT